MTLAFIVFDCIDKLNSQSLTALRHCCTCAKPALGYCVLDSWTAGRGRKRNAHHQRWCLSFDFVRIEQKKKPST